VAGACDSYSDAARDLLLPTYYLPTTYLLPTYYLPTTYLLRSDFEYDGVDFPDSNFAGLSTNTFCGGAVRVRARARAS
jgi:hypothetical protein